MRVDRVTATIRYSQDSGKGAWKSLELGAEAQVTPNEDWNVAQKQLYLQLGQQIKAIWSNGSNGKARDPVLPAPQSTSVRDHWCTQHQQEWNKFTKGNQIWWSHRTTDGWCKEP